MQQIKKLRKWSSLYWRPLDGEVETIDCKIGDHWMEKWRPLTVVSVWECPMEPYYQSSRKLLESF
jgi:hypothetical protein